MWGKKIEDEREREKVPKGLGTQSGVSKAPKEIPFYRAINMS